MRRFVVRLVLAASLGLNVTVAVLLLVGTPLGGSEPEPAGCVLDDLELNPEEMAAAERARGDFPAFRQRHVERMAGLRAELADALAALPPDRPRVSRVLRAIAAEQAAFQERVIEKTMAVRDALGPERRARYDALLLPRVQRGGVLRCE
jgi:hypothetical protein